MMNSRLTAGTATLLAAFLLVIAQPRSVAGPDSGNGVYGGYVGSSAWFSQMRESAQNQAMLRSITGQAKPRRLPPNCVEFAGKVAFPGGNPFPDHRVPDLVIRCANLKADPVTRYPFLNRDQVFYTVLQRGQTYNLFWMFYFGSQARFASIHVQKSGPARRRFTIAYRAPAAQARPAPAKGPAQSTARTPLRPRSIPPDVDGFDLSGFPKTPGTFEEQTVLAAIQTSQTHPSLKAEAHERLAAYYAKKGDAARAKAEREKAEYWQASGR